MFVSALKWRAGDENGKAIAKPCWWTHRCLCRNAAPELHFPACTQLLAWRSVTRVEPSFCVHFLPLYLLVFVWVVFFIISYLLVKNKLLKARQQSSWWQVGLSNLTGISSATSIRISCWRHRPPPPTPCGRSPGTASASRTGPVSRAWHGEWPLSFGTNKSTVQAAVPMQGTHALFVLHLLLRTVYRCFGVDSSDHGFSYKLKMWEVARVSWI